jgi:hypothetical protein
LSSTFHFWIYSRMTGATEVEARNVHKMDQFLTMQKCCATLLRIYTIPTIP